LAIGNGWRTIRIWIPSATSRGFRRCCKNFDKRHRRLARRCSCCQSISLCDYVAGNGSRPLVGRRTVDYHSAARSSSQKDSSWSGCISVSRGPSSHRCVFVMAVVAVTPSLWISYWLLISKL
jgi:hypothetical protein